MGAITVDHGSRAHALLSASSAHRWLECTPSARLEESFSEDEESSVYAAEGTFAHELAETELLYAVDQIELNEYVRRKNELAKSEFHNSENTDEVEKYVSYVLDAWSDAKKLDAFAEIIIEDRMDLSEWVPEGFGTNDVVIITWSYIKVIDLKFGKGVRVKADNNPQLKLYGLGALEKHGFNYAVENVLLVIHQPRLDSVSEAKITAVDLQAWGNLEVMPLAELAFNGEGEFKPGEHCRFCKAAPRCRALAEQNLELAKLEFQDPALLTDEELINVYDKLDPLQKWAAKVANYFLAEALAGKQWKGFKLVEGRSNRSIAESDTLFKALSVAGFEHEEVTNSKLKGIGDLTKILGKAKFDTVLGPFVTKPQGKPTLTTTDDPRPELNSVEAVKDLFEEED